MTKQLSQTYGYYEHVLVSFPDMQQQENVSDCEVFYIAYLTEHLSPD